MTMEEIYFIEIYTALIELKGGATENGVNTSEVSGLQVINT